MNISINEINMFKEFFSGNLEAYGKHIHSTEKNEKGKKEGNSYTVNKSLTTEEYIKHLKGESGLGIIPITKEGKVKFTTIDIDVYKDSKLLQVIVDKIYSHNLPFLPFFSKSGGLHLYTFFDNFYEYKHIQPLLKEYLSVLNVELTVEIFPKQITLNENQKGSWINLPYYNSNETTQYLIGKDFKAISFREALIEINKKLISVDLLKTYIESLKIFDGPPCLQTIFYNKECDMRNEYLFNLAIYLKAKYEDDFPLELHECNKNLFSPITTSELTSTIINSHTKKDYTYKCNQPPLKELCKRELCKLRKYGVSGDEIAQLSFEDFIKYNSDPPFYEWLVNGISMTFFSETDLINQQRFRELCLRDLRFLPMRVKEAKWVKIINRALSNVIIKEINPGEDLSPGSIFMNCTYEFLERRIHAESLPQILIDRVYKDKDTKEYIFRGNDYLNFLFNQKNFKYFKVTEIQNRLKKLGAKTERVYVDKNNKGIRVWKVPFKVVKDFRIDPSLNINLDFLKEQNDEQLY